jgi:hypothetical protein
VVVIAANAVDLVVSQLNSNETGVPPWPRMLQFPGRWPAFFTLRMPRLVFGCRSGFIPRFPASSRRKAAPTVQSTRM